MNSRHDDLADAANLCPEMFETLEERRMLSVVLNHKTRVLEVSGTGRGDKIVVQRDSTIPERIAVRVNGTVTAVFVEKFKRIQIHGNKGNDRVILSDDYGELPRSRVIRVFGDSGDDTLVGGFGPDSLAGGGGDDNIDGGSNNDTLLGEVGNDTLTGSFGHDSLIGGEGDDLIFGKQGNDTVEAGEGNDVVFGGTSNDSIRGGDGDDTLYGNEDSDTLYGDAGDDIFYDGPGQDIMTP